MFLVCQRNDAWTTQCWKLIWKLQPRNANQYKQKKQFSINSWTNLKSFLIKTIVENVYTMTGIPNYFFSLFPFFFLFWGRTSQNTVFVEHKSETLLLGLVWRGGFHRFHSSVIQTKLYCYLPESLPNLCGENAITKALIDIEVIKHWISYRWGK